MMYVSGTRPEVIFPSPLTIKDPGESAIVIDSRGPDDVWVSEQILFGRTPLMKKLSVDIKENMFKYLTSGKDRRGPEHLIARFLETKGYDIIRGIIVDWHYLPPGPRRRSLGESLHVYSPRRMDLTDHPIR